MSAKVRGSRKRPPASAQITSLPLTNRAGLVDRAARAMAAREAHAANQWFLQLLEQLQREMRAQQIPQQQIDDRLIDLAHAVKAKLFSEILLNPGKPSGGAA